MTTRSLPEETAFRWRQFTGLGTTRVHWDWRGGWRPGRWSYWWYLDLTGAAELAALAADLLAELRLECLDPAVHLHVSLQQVGFTDEVTAGQARALLAAAGRLGLAPLELTFGPADPNPESVVLRVSPWEPIQQHRLRLRRVTEPIVGTLTGADDHFWPHVSIGYVNAVVPAAPIAEALRALPDRRVTLTARELRLVRLNRDDRLWKWDVVGAVPLSAGPARR
ncbi:hypothetical protein ACWT_2285 [Actinoplanes sp. SE50]|uniref:2'-5' RNA ligase family protein n=1 Tax=unclassified Actinoplanes TaxID=2626549 RepID=UPI00023ED1E7|nr:MULTISPECIES: 2'-5' RNA ligase family protein [unclassified Actinoplanes]AEV83307.1 hypothetical protein ACPL_2412 [Actinoplanes sp. SE50/110]ATO81700.1 hypothetical protein ACWT_2285 [Actinoplanes sp. SE50]SLL99108.1 hypothetical protein ACSP50_2339 [Actinoplanes sp. SE50/110]